MIDAIVNTTIWKNCYEPKQLTGKTLAGKQKKNDWDWRRRGRWIVWQKTRKKRGSKNAFFLKNCCRAIRFQSISNRNTQMYSKYVAPITTYFLYLELTICTKKEALQPINFLRQNSYFFFSKRKPYCCTEIGTYFWKERYVGAQHKRISAKWIGKSEAVWVCFEWWVQLDVLHPHFRRKSIEKQPNVNGFFFFLKKKGLSTWVPV